MIDWLGRIRTPSHPRDFIGENLDIPKSGDRIRVLRGPHKGVEFDVVGVWGPAFDLAQKIYVVLPEERLSWLWPWDVEILKS